ncbi:MAG: adenosine deaminase [Chloroflexi bacterium]|nr:adenosine deaminase [Chloroflexota bacterium]
MFEARSLGPLAELHVHLGGSVDPAVMWTIAHDQGIKLPSKDYWDFVELTTVPIDGRVKSLNEYAELFYWTELIQSSPEAIERSIHQTIGGGYRKCSITTMELRFNPMKRNRGGERDLDHIIAGAIRGMERAELEYPAVRAGLIIMMDRTLTFEQNQIIARKALAYRERGIIGIDIAGPRHPDFHYRDYAEVIEECRCAGLGITIHCGEEGDPSEMWEVLEYLKPRRVGHGILAAEDEKLMAELVRQNVVLEICPTSNIKTSAVQNLEHVRRILRAFISQGVKFSISTDGPEMLQTNIAEEFELLVNNGVLTEKEAAAANRCAHEASFLT